MSRDNLFAAGAAPATRRRPSRSTACVWGTSGSDLWAVGESGTLL
jgi:hypothetical protein